MAKQKCPFSVKVAPTLKVHCFMIKYPALFLGILVILVFIFLMFLGRNIIHYLLKLPPPPFFLKKKKKNVVFFLAGMAQLKTSGSNTGLNQVFFLFKKSISYFLLFLPPLLRKIQIFCSGLKFLYLM